MMSLAVASRRKLLLAYFARESVMVLKCARHVTIACFTLLSSLAYTNNLLLVTST